VTASNPYVRTIPNVLTIARLIAVPVFIWMIWVAEGPTVAAGLLFAAASITDWFDGYLARRLELVSRFGRVADPLADRLLVNGAVLMLTIYDARMAGWELVLVIARDLVAWLGFRRMRQAGIPFEVSFAGKCTMSVMMAGITGALLFHEPMWPVWMLQVGLAASAGVMAQYFWAYREALKSAA
jgi:CDP-diacylglycerol--glycerol-3-phosphate 3-phosphatidyltransferase